MASLGELEYVEGRSASKTTTLVLQRCLRSSDREATKAIAEFLQSMAIQPEAFFRDIDGDWNGRPFLGGHVFKVVKAAGYEGTEHDLWTAVTGYPAPYAVKPTKAPKPPKPAKTARRKKGAADTNGQKA